VTQETPAKPSNDLAIKYGIPIALLMLMVTLAAPYGVREWGWPDELAESVKVFVLINGILVLLLIRFCDPADPVDRRLVVRELMWFFVPLFIINNLWLFTSAFDVPPIPISSWLGVGPGTPLVLLERLISLIIGMGIMLLAFGLYVSMRWPFARRNLMLKSKNEDAARAVLTRLALQGTVELAEAAEIRIAPSVYYSFLMLLFWVAFVILETVLGEFLDDKLGAVGYIGASIIAIGIGAVIYPFHKRAVKYVNLQSDAGIDSAAEDPRTALAAIGRSMRFQFPMVGRWLLYLVLFIFGALLVGVAIGLAIRVLK